MKKSLFFLGLTALTLASCSQEDVLSINNRLQDRNAIAFTARTPKTTRANDMTTNGLESFMVYGMKGDINERDEDPSYKLTDFFGGAVEFKRVFNTDDEAYPETYFMSDMPYYYPGDGSPLTFVAYAPSDLKNVTLDDQCKLSFSEFTVNEDITEQLDPVWHREQHIKPSFESVSGEFGSIERAECASRGRTIVILSLTDKASIRAVGVIIKPSCGKVYLMIAGNTLMDRVEVKTMEISARHIGHTSDTKQAFTDCQRLTADAAGARKETVERGRTHH